MAEEKKFPESKKATGYILGMATTVLLGVASVATGKVDATLALDKCLSAVTWLTGMYLGAQGAQDTAGGWLGKIFGKKEDK